MAIETFNRKILINSINKFKKFKFFYNGAYYNVDDESDINQDSIIGYDVNGEAFNIDINLIQKIKIGSVTLTPQDIQTAIDNIKHPESAEEKADDDQSDDSNDQPVEAPNDNEQPEKEDKDTKKPEKKEKPEESIKLGDFVQFINEKSVHNGIRSNVSLITNDGYILIKAFSVIENKMVRIVDKIKNFKLIE